MHKEIRTKNLNEYFNKQKKFSGSVLVAKNNEILFQESYGYANKEKGIRNTLQTKFMIGSMTKTVTALSILQLTEKGLLSLQQDMNEFFPDVYKGSEITIHHLLTHTSGLPNYLTLTNQIKWGEHHTPLEILQIVKNQKLKFLVGKKWSYSNTNYLVLGLIIEMVSGMSYHQYVKNNIFIPANMNHSDFIDEDPQNVASSYVNGKKGYNIDSSLWFAAGDMVSTVGDFYLFDRAIHDGKLLKYQTVIEMQKPHYDGKLVKYGYGLIVKNNFGCKSICHSGGIPNGYTAHYENYVEDDITIIVMSNDFVKYQILSLKGAGGTYINREVAALIFGKKVGVFKKIF